MFKVWNGRLYMATSDNTDGKIKKGDLIYFDSFTRKIIVENDKKYNKYEQKEINLEFEAKDITKDYDYFRSLNGSDSWEKKGVIDISYEENDMYEN